MDTDKLRKIAMDKDQLAQQLYAKPDDNPYKALGSAPGSDALANFFTGGLGSSLKHSNRPITLGTIGHLIGYMKGDPAASIDPKAGTRFSSFIPGVGGYRTALADRAIDEALSKGKRSRSAVASERFGDIINTATLTGLGRLLGGSPGAKAGAVLSGLSNLGGYLGGYFKSPRNTKEHQEYLNDDNLVLKNLLLPGVASFQRGRRARQRYNAI